MLKQNVLLYLRNIKKHKSSFLINSIGLSTGLACVLLVYLWVSDELIMDKFHKNDDRIHQVFRNVPNADGELRTQSSNSSQMLTTFKEELPEVERIVAVHEIYGGGMIQTNQKKISSNGVFASEDYFKIFSFPLVAGSKEDALKDVNSIAISNELAISLFDSEVDPIGKPITIKNGEYGLDAVMTINGVFELPKNTTEDFDFVVSYKKFLQNRNPDYIHWDSNSSSMYVLLRPEIDSNEFNDKIADFIQKKDADNTATVFLSKYSDNYLNGRFENGQHAGGRISYVYLFSMVAIFILLIACINFMNLSTAKASKRFKEIGIKKVVGANRKALIFQFLIESVLLSFFSLIVACALVWLIMPWFNVLTGKEIVFSIDARQLGVLLGVSLVTGLLAGSYPALYLTKFNAVRVLKGKIGTAFGELMLRKGLVVFQFAISILLIVAVSVIYMQLDFVQSKNLGYEKDSVIVFDRQDGLVNNMETFIEEAKNVPGVVNASYMQGDMTNFSNTSWGHSWPGQTEAGKNLAFKHAHVGPDFIETMGIEITAGRSYVDEKPDTGAKIILNETAVRLMGLENPIGTIIDMRGPNREIIGVVKDFHIQSLYEEIAPMALLCKTEWVGTLMVKIRAGEEKQTLTALTALYNEFSPGLAFDYRFLDSQYQKLYQAEQRVATLSKYFAGMAILISCLGLFGLAAFSAERRRKEISIRKVLGQSIRQVTTMLSGEFIKLVVLSMLISLPVAYLLASNWLSQFAYKISLHLGYFVGAGLIALEITLLTVGSQAIKAATKNPINALKEE